MKYVFDIEPIGKPRMTQRDKWAKRECVTKYYSFKDTLKLQAYKQGYKISDELDIEFIIPFPKSYSIKKRASLLNQPHQEKPDIDNMLKAFMDSLTDDDKEIHTIHASKLWGEKGQIIVNVHEVTTKDLSDPQRHIQLMDAKLWMEKTGENEVIRYSENSI